MGLATQTVQRIAAHLSRVVAIIFHPPSSNPADLQRPLGVKSRLGYVDGCSRHIPGPSSRGAPNALRSNGEQTVASRPVPGAVVGSRRERLLREDKGFSRVPSVIVSLAGFALTPSVAVRILDWTDGVGCHPFPGTPGGVTIWGKLRRHRVG
jgi:hypothetical protein